MAITTRALAYPPGLEIEDIEPRRVEVRIEDKPAPKTVNSKPGYTERPAPGNGPRRGSTGPVKFEQAQA